MYARAVTLTFDDGPDPVWTPRMLEVLDEHDASATFFMMSSLAATYPDLVGAVLDAGHAVEFHCARHTRHTEASREATAVDTERGLLMLRALGAEPRYWRPPWGIGAPWTQELANEFGLALAGWTADTHDWRGDPAAEMLDAVGPLLGPGAVVLMHDGLGPGALRAGCDETVALVGAMIPYLWSLGCEPAALDALERIPSLRGAVVPEAAT